MNGVQLANMERSTSRVVVTPQRHVAAVHGRRRSAALSCFSDADVELPDWVLVGGVPRKPDATPDGQLAAGER